VTSSGVLHVLDTVLALIRTIPATFWGVVVGSGFTLAGITLTNQASARRLTQQFEHERQIRNQDRELALKKEIFLELLEGFTAAANTLVQATNLTISDQEITAAFNARLPTMSKARLVLSVETLAKVDIINERIQSAVNKAMVMREEIRNEDAKTDAEENAIRNNPSLIGRGSGIGDMRPRRRKTMEKYLTFRKELVAEQQAVNVLGSDIILALRKELNIPTDREAWALLSKARYERRQAYDHELNTMIQDQIDKKTRAEA
jgi:hypothetical protein